MATPIGPAASTPSVTSAVTSTADGANPSASTSPCAALSSAAGVAGVSYSVALASIQPALKPMDRELLRPALAALDGGQIMALPSLIITRIRDIDARLPK